MYRSKNEYENYLFVQKCKVWVPATRKMIIHIFQLALAAKALLCDSVEIFAALLRKRCRKSAAKYLRQVPKNMFWQHVQVKNTGQKVTMWLGLTEVGLTELSKVRLSGREAKGKGPKNLPKTTPISKNTYRALPRRRSRTCTRCRRSRLASKGRTGAKRST